MSANTLLIIILVILIVEFLFEKFVGYLNYRNLSDKLPDKLKGIYDQDKYEKSIKYNRENARFGFFTSVLSFSLILILILAGFFGYLDEFIRQYFQSEIVISLVFFGILYFASDIIGTPFSLYDTFVIEEKYGFNKTTAKVYFIDKFKGILLTLILGGGIIYILLLLIQLMGGDFWIYFWLVISAFTLFMNVFYTSLIVPLFNKLIPLEDGDLRQSIDNYGRKVKFPVDQIFVIDGSKRSTKANAYFSGLGKKKKVVLYDTLINEQTTKELTAVLAHEVGHYKKKHIIQGLLVSIIQTGIILFIMSIMIFNPILSEAFGSSYLSIHLNLLAFFILFSPISTITGILMNMVSRKNEYEADRFAAETYDGESLKSALIKLSVNNLGNLTPHPFYVFLNYSHPTVLDRINALDSIKMMQSEK